MPPKRANKNASTASEDAIPSFPAPPTIQTIQTTQPDEAHTPEQSPRKQAVGITQAQKQALIDNLQLEITERARKLRAQYALQAQGLRSRLEMRVNRIPTALRKRKIQDLLDEHAEKADPKPAPAVPVKQTVKQVEEEERPRKAVKRMSEHISTNDFGAEDKENAEPSQPDLPVTKKRAVAKPATITAPATPNTKAARTASRTTAKPLQPSTVLSPKSHNSRTLPRSPFKSTTAASPEKPLPARPINPAKPAAARAASRQQGAAAAKKLAPPPPPSVLQSEGEGRSSGVSDSSAGTTIVRKAATGAKGKVAAAKSKAAAVGRAAVGAGKKAGTGAKKENVPPTTTPAAGGGRTLRKRG